MGSIRGIRALLPSGAVTVSRVEGLWCEGGVLIVMHERTRKTRIPNMPGWTTSGFHQPGGLCLHEARSAVRCLSSRMKGELHPTRNRL